MSHHNLQHHVMHALGHGAKHARAEGKSHIANGLTLIGIGIFLMPIPFIGIPMIIWGITKCCSSGEVKADAQSNAGAITSQH